MTRQVDAFAAGSVLRRVLVIGAVIAGLACAAPTVPTAVPVGVWGGDHVRLTVSDTSAFIEFDCGHGTLDAPFPVDSNGRFDIAGIFQHEGGPVAQDAPVAKETARYAGTINNETMKLTVTTSQPFGTFTLVLGQQGRLVKCV